MNKKLKAMLAMLMCVVTVGSMAACVDPEEQPYDIEKRASTGWEDDRMYTMQDYTSQMPNQWCSITNSDATNRDMEGYMMSEFFEFNYQFDASGSIVPGGYTVNYSAATKLEDVTADYVGQYGITEEDVEEGHHAFKMTLRSDLKWDDGTPIKAQDFVYSMEQQLSPKYLFSTASNYYTGNYIIHNSQEYVYQGQAGWFAGDTAYKTYSTDLDDKLVFTLGNPTENEEWDGAEASVRGSIGFPASYTAADVAAYLSQTYGMPGTAEEVAALQGKTLAEIKADAALKATWDGIIGWWQTEPNEELDFFVAEYTYPAMNFSEVGYFAENDTELVIVIDNTLNPIDAFGNLTYEAGYYFSSWPLVKKDVWEACEKAPTGDQGTYTNTYATSVATSPSWGPYKVTDYQMDKSYTIERNTKWYGYGMEQYAKQYQTDKIECQYIAEWATAWQLFQKGEVNAVGMDASIAGEYRNSRQAYFTPDTYTFDLNIQSKANTRTETRNNLMLNYTEFRQAMSLAFDRDDYCAVNSPSSQGALGLLNSMYYYDVESKGVYRETEQAKTAILEAYGATKTEEGKWKIGSTEYENIDDAVDAMTGYDVALARQKMTEAYNKAKAAGDYNDGEQIILTYGILTESANTERVKNWFQKALDNATVGTPLEGKITIAYFTFSEATWSDQFAAGEYDLCFGAWGSAAFNPYYLLGETQISESNRYALGWDPDTVELTITLNGKDYTYNLNEWNSNMQGKADAKLNLTLAPFTEQDRLTVLGKVEAAVLQAYYSIPVYARTSAALMSYKTDYISYEYNTFMSYGGLRYMSYNFDDAEWAAFVSAKGGKLNYTFSRD